MATINDPSLSPPTWDARSGTHPSPYTAIGRQAIAYAVVPRRRRAFRNDALRYGNVTFFIIYGMLATLGATRGARERAGGLSLLQPEHFPRNNGNEFRDLGSRRRLDAQITGSGPYRYSEAICVCVCLLSAPDGQPFPVNAAAPRKLCLTLPVLSAQLLYLLRNSDEKHKSKSPSVLQETASLQSRARTGKLAALEHYRRGDAHYLKRGEPVTKVDIFRIVPRSSKGNTRANAPCNPSAPRIQVPLYAPRFNN